MARLLISVQTPSFVNLAGVELRYLVDAISRKSAGYYVSNIYGITKNSLLFKLHHPAKPDVFMMLSTFGVWITSKRISQIEPNRMLKRLRSDLLRAKITGMQQIGAERIAYVRFSNFEREMVLVAEMFGDGNMVLCNADMKILALLHSIEVRHRRLAVGLEYAPPPQSPSQPGGLDIFGLKRTDFDGMARSDLEAVRWIGRSLGFPRKYAEEIFCRAGIDPKRKAGLLAAGEIDRLCETAGRLVGDIEGGKHDAVIIRGGGGPAEIYPVRIGAAQSDGGGMTVEPVDSFMDGLDKIFTEEIVSAGKTAQSAPVNKKLAEYRRRLEEQARAIEAVKHRSDGISTVARSVMGCASAGIMSVEDPGATELLRESGAKLVRIKGVPHIVVMDEKIKVNPESPPQAVASALFDEAKRQSNAVATIEGQMRVTEKRIASMQNRSGGEGVSAGFQEIVKRTWFQRYRWFFTSDNMMAIGGRDSSSNSAVIRKHLEKNDRVFHAEIFGSPFFILKDSAGATASSLDEVARATVCFSRAWREAMYGLSAYWVEPGQVKRAAPSGQFLPKGSFTIDGQRNFVRVASLRLAVGILRHGGGGGGGGDGGDALLACGPPEPIKKQCACYAVIEPSSGNMAEAAKRIRLEFSKVNEEMTGQIPLDEFVRVLPAGGSHITELGEGENAGVR